MKSIFYSYIFKKINELLKVIGTKTIQEEELTPDTLLELDPLGVIADTFKTILENLHEKNEKLKITNEKLNILFNTINDGIYVINSNYEIVMINNTELKLINRRREDVLGDKCYKVFARENFPCKNCKLNELKKRNSPYIIHNVNLNTLKIRKDCPRELVDICFFPVFENEVLVYIRDLTETNKNIKKIQYEREKLSVIINSMAEGILLVDNTFKVQLVNLSMERILDKKEDLLLNKYIFEIFSKELKEEFLKAYNEKKTVNIYEYKYYEKFLEISIAPIISEENVEGVVAIFRDITERKKLEEEFLKMEKLESVGLLAGGIAHDFNNILTAALGNIELCEMFFDNKEKLLERLKLLEKSIYRAKSLTDKLLTFSKGGAPIKEIVDIKEIVKDTVEFAISGTSIDVKYYFEENLWKANVDPGLISQVFTNLAVNSKNALTGKYRGVIEVKIENFSKNGEKFLKIKFKDNGCGIPERILSKIFDPFYTTDKSHSGLGLAIVYNIIKNHSGKISVKSEPGKGTEFEILLPAVTTNNYKREKIKDNNKIEKSFKKILIMDDDKDLRNAAKDILELHGYKIFEARNGEEAIEIYKKEKIDLLIIDLTIVGGMGGKETIKVLKHIDPNVKAIVISGYSNDPVLTNYKEYGFIGRVEKPFLFKDLIEIIKSIID